MAGAVVIQSYTSRLLSSPTDTARSAAAAVLAFFLLVSQLQLGAMAFLSHILGRRAKLDTEGISAQGYGLLPSGELWSGEQERDGGSSSLKTSRSATETARGTCALGTSVALVATSWIVFFVTLSR